MLEIGNHVFTEAEEKTHFSLWAIIKSPLIIGAALKDTYTSIPATSLAIMKNKDVIGYNQDSLGVAASFVRRWTEEGYEIWAGPLSGNRTVAALINNLNTARTLNFDLATVGIQKAGVMKDVWHNYTAKHILGSYTGVPIEAHGTLLLEFGETTPAGHYDSTSMAISG